MPMRRQEPQLKAKAMQPQGLIEAVPATGELIHVHPVKIREMQLEEEMKRAAREIKAQGQKAAGRTVQILKE